MAFHPDLSASGVAAIELSTGLFLDTFDAYLAPLLNHRAVTFRAVFSRLVALGKPLTIVETGCLRELRNFAGDGQSTFLFDCLVASCGGSVWSVDISQISLAAARSATSPNVHLVLNDSVAFLGSFGRPIDFLYLDSVELDGNEPLISARHHLHELCGAMRWLKSGAIVMVDDTWLVAGKPFGKGMLVAEHMAMIGASLIAEGYQMAWTV